MASIATRKKEIEAQAKELFGEDAEDTNKAIKKLRIMRGMGKISEEKFNEMMKHIREKGSK